MTFSAGANGRPGIRERRHRRARLVEEIAWMQKYIHSLDWSDPRKDPVTETEDDHPQPR